MIFKNGLTKNGQIFIGKFKIKKIKKFGKKFKKIFKLNGKKTKKLKKLNGKIF